jgi:hypothetical protein
MRVLHMYFTPAIPQLIHHKRDLPTRDVSIASKLDRLHPAAIHLRVPLPRSIILVCLTLKLNNTVRVKRVVVVELVQQQELAPVRAVVANPDAAEGFAWCGRVQLRVESCVGGDLFADDDAPD